MRPPTYQGSRQGGPGGEGAAARGEEKQEGWPETGPHSRPSSISRVCVLHRAWPPWPFSSEAVALLSQCMLTCFPKPGYRSDNAPHPRCSADTAVVS